MEQNRNKYAELTAAELPKIEVERGDETQELQVVKVMSLSISEDAVSYKVLLEDGSQESVTEDELADLMGESDEDAPAKKKK